MVFGKASADKEDGCGLPRFLIGEQAVAKPSRMAVILCWQKMVSL